MTSPLRVIIADDEPRMRDYFTQCVERLGHHVVGTASNGRQLIEQCRQLHPELVITDVKMPDMDGIDAAGEIYDTEAVPIILVSAFHDPDLLERAAHQHVLAYLVKPVKETDLAPAITLATQRFQEFQAMRKEADDLKQALEDRKLIERAKGILMKRAALDEPDAFRRLQKLASSKSQKLVDIARMIVTTEEALEG